MMQTIKPRARVVQPGVWQVRGRGRVAFGRTLRDAFERWKDCVLTDQTS